MLPATPDKITHRGVWTIADQGCSSLFNLLVGVASARFLPAIEFGLFAIYFSGFLLARGIFRALVLEPIMVLNTSEQSDEQKAHALGLAVAVSVISSVILIISTWLLSGSTNFVIALMYLFFVFALLCVDVLRILHMANKRPDLAAGLSILTLAIFLLTALIFRNSINTAILVMLAVVSCCVASLTITGGIELPELRIARLYHWTLNKWSFGAPLVVEFLASSGLAALAVILIGYVAVEEAAAYRGAQILAAPVHMLFLGLSTYLLVEGARSGRVIESTRVITLCMLGIGAIYFALIWLLDFLPSLLLGDTGVVSAPVAIALAAHAALSSISVGCAALLKLKIETLKLAKLRLISAVPESFAIVIGITSGSAYKMAVCSAIALLVALPLWLLPMWRAGLFGGKSATPS